MRIVSLEEHFILPNLAVRSTAEFLETRASGSAMPEPLLARLREVGPNRIAEMDAAGISIQVLEQWGAGADSREGDDGLELARSYNDGLEKLVSAHPQRSVVSRILHCVAPKLRQMSLNALSPTCLFVALLSAGRSMVFPR